jgi:hypothetical protein
MELFIFLLVVLVVVGVPGVFYLSDREGWNTTFKRLNRVVRASIENKDKDKMLPQISHTMTDDDWDAQFKGDKNLTPVEPPQENHYIVSTYFKRAYDGSDWPGWKCKCGASKVEPVLSAFYGGLESAIKDAKKESEKHVQDANRNDQIKAQYVAKGITGREW